ncbi:MAG: GNAT family N-acetyltransferase [Candidatus Bathyarchaeia archaeon]
MRVFDDIPMFNIKKMSTEDIEFAVQITDMMNWNLTEKDFKFMMSLEPEGCFVLLYNSERVGITTTISFGRIGWIGDVIVNENHRRKGAGNTLLKHAINYLKSKGAETIGLYSYMEKINFYTRLGFRRESEFTVLKGKASASSIEKPT